MRIVRENLYNFHKTGDVKSGLNIGIRTKIAAWLDEMGVKNYTINDDYTIDVDGDVNLQNLGLTEFPPFIKFGIVRGNFFCGKNELSSLIGSPKEVYGAFGCSSNRLTNLDGAPIKVGGIFRCVDNLRKFTKNEIREICDVENTVMT